MTLGIALTEDDAMIGRSMAIDAMADGMASRFAERALEVARRQLAAAQDGASAATWRSIIARLEQRRR
jgi:hypothetical protein